MFSYLLPRIVIAMFHEFFCRKKNLKIPIKYNFENGTFKLTFMPALPSLILIMV